MEIYKEEHDGFMLQSHFNSEGLTEAGCDEAGRGCLAGAVFAAAVILPPNYENSLLNDSKQLSAKKRDALRAVIERDGLTLRPEYIIVDGNRFKPYHDCRVQHGDKVSTPTEEPAIIPHTTIVKGDGKYLSIAAASILAKTYRDDYMTKLHQQHPHYGWDHNAGYPTRQHRAGIAEHGTTPFHRMTFNLLGDRAQLELDFK